MARDEKDRVSEPLFFTKKYCRQCGTKLLAKRVIDHYDETTGERVYMWEQHCESCDGVSK